MPLLIQIYQLHLVIRSMRTSRSVRMNRDYGKWNILLSRHLYFSATGGMAPEATVFYKRLASLLASKWSDHYSITMRWLRYSLSFSLLQSAIQCLHGARSSMQNYIQAPTFLDLVRCEAKFPLWWHYLIFIMVMFDYLIKKLLCWLCKRLTLHDIINLLTPFLQVY